MTPNENTPEKDSHPEINRAKRISKVYGYQDADGRLVFEVVRFDPKDFRQRRPLMDGRFAWGLSQGWYAPSGKDYRLLKDSVPDPSKPPSNDAVWLDKIDPLLYNLPLVKTAVDAGGSVYIVEGEKDADSICAQGYIGTTCPMGAGKWQGSHTEVLRGCSNAIIISDKDACGREHATSVAEELLSIGVNVKVIEMPDRSGVAVKDFTDWLEVGGTKEEFDRLVADTPLLIPSGVDDADPSSLLILKHGDPCYFGQNDEVRSVNESLFAELYAMEHIVLYDPDEKAFYRYDDTNGLYSEVTENVIKKEIGERILQISREHNLPSLERQKKNSVLTNIVVQLKGIVERRDAFAKQSHYVHLGNGVLSLKGNDADLLRYSPVFYSRNQSPIIFNADANCDRFLNELLLPAVHSDDALLIQKYAGLCLLGNNLVQRFLILDGEPGRGKSTLALIIQKLIGLSNVTELRTRHLAERFELFRYRKKTMLVGVDVPGNFLSQKGSYVIKSLLGGDYFDAEQKCGTGSFQLQGRYCVIIISNSRLQIKLDGDLGAWKRRLLIVRFEAPPPAKKIPHFADQLIKEEGSGILNWALQGLEMLMEDISRYGDVAMSKQQADIVDALLAESESVRHFLSDSVEASKGSDLSVQEIVERYAAYCLAKGWSSKPITIVYREVDVLMLELFHCSKTHNIKRNDRSVRGYHNVQFKGEEDFDVGYDQAPEYTAS